MKWPLVKLGDVLTEARPGFASGKEAADGILQVRMNNITTDGSFDWTKTRRVPKIARNLNELLVQPGDILFNATNSPELVGKSACFEGLKEPITFSNHFLRLKLKANLVHAGYLNRWLVDQWKKGIFAAVCKQWVNQATVSRDRLLAMRFSLPPLSEQRCIAAILDQADALRAKRRAALAKLDSLTQSIFLEMFGDPVTNPKRWTKIKLASVFADKPRLGTTKPANGTGYLVVRVGEIGREQIVLYRCGRVQLDLEELPRYALRSGDILLARAIGSRDQLGKCSYFAGHSETVVADSHVMRLRVNDAICDAYWLYFLIASSGGRKLLLSKGGATAVQFNINGTQISDLDIPFPPRDLQASFTKIAEDLKRLRSEQETSEAKLLNLFASLQHRAFRGEL